MTQMVIFILSICRAITLHWITEDFLYHMTTKDKVGAWCFQATNVDQERRHRIELLINKTVQTLIGWSLFCVMDANQYIR